MVCLDRVRGWGLRSLVVGSLAGLFGCAPVGADDEVDDDMLAELEEDAEPTMLGGTSQSYPAGVVAVIDSQQSDVHTGVVVAMDAAADWALVVTNQAWVSRANLTKVTVSSRQMGTTVSRAAEYVNEDPSTSNHRVLQVSALPSGKATLSTRSADDLVKVVKQLRCYEHSSASKLLYTDVVIDTATNSEVVGSSAAPYEVQASDLGAVCIDLLEQKVVGLVSNVSTDKKVTIRRLGAIYADLENLAAVRADPRSVRWALKTSESTARCVEAGWLLGLHSCDLYQTQELWMDFTVDTERPRLVSDYTGRCIGVPAASTTSPTTLKLERCSTALSQRWDMTLWGDATGGWKIKPAHLPSKSYCLTANSLNVLEQRTCATGTTNLNQRWLPIWL